MRVYAPLLMQGGSPRKKGLESAIGPTLLGLLWVDNRFFKRLVLCLNA